MNILWAIHLYPPRHNAGAEMHAHTINRHLLVRGHNVRVLHYDGHKYGIKSMYSFEGVDVFLPEVEQNLFDWADVICTHLDYTKTAIWKAKSVNKPIIHFTHNDITYPSILNAEYSKLKVIHNSKWVADKLNYNLPSFVFPPPVDEWYKCQDKGRKYITLINLNENKGANYFYHLAKQLPQFQFLAVKGSYENQIVKNFPNVTVWNNTPDIRKVYEVSKVVLMPSHYESWGRVAGEAMLNGIPVIANPTPGLMENLGNAGILINRKQTDKWAEQIKKLMTDESYYNNWSDRVKKRAAELSPDWEKLITFITQR